MKTIIDNIKGIQDSEVTVQFMVIAENVEKYGLI